MIFPPNPDNMAGDKLMDDTELRFLLVSGHGIRNAGYVLYVGMSP